MAATKTVDNDVLDAALNYIKDNCDRMVVCEDDPADYADAILDKSSGGHKLAIRTITPTDYTGPSDGDDDGRKLRINMQSSIPVNDTGNASVIALCRSTGTPKLLYTTTCTIQVITGGNFVTIPIWDIEIGDPK